MVTPPFGRETNVTTYADILRPGERSRALVFDGLVILAGSLLPALAARIAVPLPFSPVPVTGQTLAVLLLGAVLGSRRGSLAVVAYLAEGAMGGPVFAGGTGGVARLLGPTGGYLFGFVLAAYLVGVLAERGWDRSPLRTAAAMLLGTCVIYLAGLPWLGLFVGPRNALSMGLYPFLVGDALKIVLGVLLLPSGWAILRSLGYEETGR